MPRKLLRFPIRYPWAALLLAVAITAAAAAQFGQLRVESDWTEWIPSGDDALGNLEELEDIFGSSYLVNILIVREDHPDGIYNPGTLALIEEITTWLRTRPELETALNSDLRSLSTVNDIRGDETGMVVEPFMKTVPSDRAEALAIRSSLERNGIYLGVVSSYDGKAAAIVVREAEAMRSTPAGTYYTLRAYFDELEARGVPEKLYITGRPIIEGLFDIYIPQEGYRILPFIFLMLAVFLYLSFRTLRGVLIPFAVVACTEIWMFGFLGAWGHPMYSITSILPILIVSIAVADSVHLLARYYEAQAHDPSADRTLVLETTVEDMIAPVFLTSLTTAIGFLSMTISDLVPVKDFGVVISVGILSAFVLTMLIIPAVLALLPLRAGPVRRGISRRVSLDAILVAPTRFAERHPVAIILVFATLLASSLAGMLQLTTDSGQVNQFPPHHHLRYADALVNRHFAGSSILDVHVDAKVADALKEPTMLARIDEFQRRIQHMDIVGDSLSIAELIKRMNRVMNEDRPEMERIPAGRDLVAQYLLLYAISGDPGDFDDLVDYDYQHAHVMVFVKTPGTAAARSVVARARHIARDVFGTGPTAAKVKFSGQAYTNAHFERYVNSSQLLTLTICMPTLFGLSWLVFRSPLLALLCIAPVSLAVVGIYGTMGYIGLPTDVATTMLGAMTLGIGIDFAIHYLHRYGSCLRNGVQPGAAAIETARTAGRALFYNAVVLIGGFIVLLGARLYPQLKLGVLVSATMAICYAATMVLFPAALTLLWRRRAPVVIPDLFGRTGNREASRTH